VLVETVAEGYGDDMTGFDKWCTETTTDISGNRLVVLVSDNTRLPKEIPNIAKELPQHYAEPVRLSEILAKHGRTALATYVSGKLPLTKQIRSGDLGEILGLTYLTEKSKFTVPIRRLRWKDHRDMAMRGEDVLAFETGKESSDFKVAKAEVKSRLKLSKTVVTQAREALSANQGLPSNHALSFVADRLHTLGNSALADLLDEFTLNKRLKESQVTHFLFTLSGNDPQPVLQSSLSGYKEGIAQLYVGVQVEEHQNFIKSVFEAVDVNGI
jgi:hypothetical protein